MRARGRGSIQDSIGRGARGEGAEDVDACFLSCQPWRNTGRDPTSRSGTGDAGGQQQPGARLAHGLAAWGPGLVLRAGFRLFLFVGPASEPLRERGKNSFLRRIRPSDPHSAPGFPPTCAAISDAPLRRQGRSFPSALGTVRPAAFRSGQQGQRKSGRSRTRVPTEPQRVQGTRSTRSVAPRSASRARAASEFRHGDRPILTGLRSAADRRPAEGPRRGGPAGRPRKRRQR